MVHTSTKNNMQNKNYKYIFLSPSDFSAFLYLNKRNIYTILASIELSDLKNPYNKLLTGVVG